MLGMEAYIEYLNKSDKTVLKALEVLDKGESFPKAPEQPIEPKVSDEGTKKTTAQADSASELGNRLTPLPAQGAAVRRPPAPEGMKASFAASPPLRSAHCPGSEGERAAA